LTWNELLPLAKKFNAFSVGLTSGKRISFNAKELDKVCEMEKGRILSPACTMELQAWVARCLTKKAFQYQNFLFHVIHDLLSSAVNVNNNFQQSKPLFCPPIKAQSKYRMDDMFVDGIATYVSLNWLEISKFPFDMMYPYWWTTHMQKMSPLSI
jgi:hypothetical protein